ncbi:MAG: SGNH/GDSL hydrolase family protein [Flavobacteriales bacterium]|nr:SGNH/GDSL hydrolase family protein [Flavobacteriales bacterium]
MIFTLLHRSAVIIALVGLSMLLTASENINDLRILHLGVLTLLLMEGALLLKSVFGSEQAGERMKGTAMSMFSVFAILVVLEAAFMFIPRSHGVGYTLGAQLWFKRYWKPVNSMGYRDPEPVKGQGRAIFFVGDSFTAGHGLKHIGDRFANVAGAHLQAAGRPSTVLNLGRNGMDTGQEYADMVKFIEQTGVEPETIVLQYFGNDIDGSAAKAGLHFQGFGPYDGVNSTVTRLVRGSYLLNYLYWIMPRGDVSSYLSYIENAYQQPDIMELHKQDLRAFKAFAHTHRLPLVVVLFPFMQDLELSEKVYMERIREFLDDEDVRYIDVSLLTGDLSPSERMVNANDGHASALVNRRVGQAIFENLSSASSPVNPHPL